MICSLEEKKVVWDCHRRSQVPREYDGVVWKPCGGIKRDVGGGAR